MSSTFSGFTNGATVRGVPITQTHGGEVFWVSNARKLTYNEKPGSDGNKGTFKDPFATLAKALSMCKAGRGDVIFVKQSHSEEFTAPFTIGVDAVSIIGLGGKVDGPSFTMGDVGAYFDITGTGVCLQNVRIPAKLPITAVAINIQGRAARIQDVMIYDHTGSFDTGIAVYGTSNVELQGVQFYLSSSFMAVYMAVSTNYTVIKDVDMIGSFSASAIYSPITSVHNYFRIINANIRNTHATGYGIRIDSTSKGIMRDSAIRTTVKGSEIATQTMDVVNCRGCSMDGCGDYVLPVNPQKGCDGRDGVSLVSSIKSFPASTSTPVMAVNDGPIVIEFIGIEMISGQSGAASNGYFKFVNSQGIETNLSLPTALTGLTTGTYINQVLNSLISSLGINNGGVVVNAGLGGLVFPAGYLAFVTTGAIVGQIKYHIRYRALDPYSTVLMY